MRQKKTKVLEILHSLQTGGIEVFFTNLLKARNANEKENFEIDVWTLCNDTPQHFDNTVKEQGCRIIRPRIVRWTSILHRPLCFLYLAWILVKYGPYDVVHLHLHSTGCFFIPLLKLFRVRKIILHSHNSYETGAGRIWQKIYPKINIFLSRFADFRFACSPEAGMDIFGKLPTKIIPYGINTAKFAYKPEIRARKRSELGINDETLAIGIVGRLMEQKNHSFMLDIFNEILKISENCELFIAGDGHLRPFLSEKAVKLGISGKTHFLGIRNDTAELYQALDCFVLPSLYEGFPVVLIEAQNSGLPCVISDTITPSIRLTDIKALSLDASPTEWAKTIVDVCKKHKRKDESSRIRQLGYDSENTARIIFGIYSSEDSK